MLTNSQLNDASNGAEDAVAKAFSASALTYCQQARLQRLTGEALVRSLVQRPKVESTSAEQSVLWGIDLGCGPGLFNNELTQQCDQLISVDFSHNMLLANGNQHSRLQSDGHQLALKGESVDWLYSNLMMQWCDAKQILQEVYRVLKPGGTAVVSTLLPGSLFELEQAWKPVNSDQHIHQYQNLNYIKYSLENIAPKQFKWQHQEMVLWYPSALALAKELKSLGANYVNQRENKGLVGKGHWKAMEQEYRRRFYCEKRQGVSATYEVLLITINKTTMKLEVTD